MSFSAFGIFLVNSSSVTSIFYASLITHSIIASASISSSDSDCVADLLCDSANDPKLDVTPGLISLFDSPLFSHLAVLISLP